MNRNTIKWRIFKSNLLVIVVLIALVTVIFNVTVRMYIEKDILRQLNRIAHRTEDTALRKGPDFFPGNKKSPAPPPPPELNNGNEVYRYYFMLDRSLREPLSLLNADYILLNNKGEVINITADEFFKTPAKLIDKINTEMSKLKSKNTDAYLNFRLSGTEYIAVIKPVSSKNSFGLGWIVIYSSLQKVNQLQWGINLILFSILIFSALIIVVFSSALAKKITEPFSSLNEHIRAIAERNFGTKIEAPMYEELQELVSNFNLMSEKLETYDKAQKTFLQNASHEFRTPLMSIQSYAEGIKHEVMDSKDAADIIVDESKRMTRLVEDLLYLSRLDTIEENYHFESLSLKELINTCIDRLNGIAAKNNIKIITDFTDKDILIQADDEKLSRAITNIVSNCIRYAKSKVTIKLLNADASRIQLLISDDGPGFDPKELPNIFERFYKGKKGVFGLGLAISLNVIEKHHGKITAENSEDGALFNIELPLQHS